ncbi:MAG: hypothetical protein K6G84_02495 [Lachnospiraceae bacterium]|nr:hypothetical protein [Lachnospiraceae bacterium]
MGLLKYFTKELAKEVAWNATFNIGAALSNISKEKALKKDDIQKQKVLKTKKYENSFLISLDEDDKTFFGGKLKARYYKIQVGELIVYRIKRMPKDALTSVVEVYAYEGTPIAGINEFMIQDDPVERVFIVSENSVEMSRIYANGVVAYRYVSTDGDSWELMDNENEYLISNSGVVVARCSYQGLGLMKKSLVVKYNLEQPEDAMIYLAMCLFFVIDKISH